MTAKFYQVGGSVRDELMGVKSKDIDYAIECDSFDAMRAAIIACNGKIFVETPQYLTIRAMVPTLGACDYSLTRKDGPSSDGRRPDSVTIGTIHEDLARRDFTMNAIAKDMITGEILDPFNGREDIQNRVIRFVGNPSDRLAEDKLRALRAIRFSITKQFSLLSSVYCAIGDLGIDEFLGVSTERIREEIAKMFACNTKKSFYRLYSDFPVIGMLVDSRGIWFKPTTENKS